MVESTTWHESSLISIRTFFGLVTHFGHVLEAKMWFLIRTNSARAGHLDFDSDIDRTNAIR